MAGCAGGRSQIHRRHSNRGAFKWLPDGSPLCLPVVWVPLLASENGELLLSSVQELQILKLGRQKRWKSHLFDLYYLRLYISFSFVRVIERTFSRR